MVTYTTAILTAPPLTNVLRLLSVPMEHSMFQRIGVRLRLHGIAASLGFPTIRTVGNAKRHLFVLPGPLTIRVITAAKLLSKIALQAMPTMLHWINA